MKQNLKLERLKNTRLTEAEFVMVTYQDSGVFEENGQVFEGLPSFYRAVLRAVPAAGSEIFIEVWLPEEWNGIFLGLGNGGMAGSIWHWELADKIKRGYAAASTDMGTSRGRDSGVNNPEVWRDFGWRATHLMTAAGKTCLYHLYGKQQRYSYFIGCSTGGQQALAEAQRFPEDYDGILAGMPANNRTFLHIYFLWNHIHLRPKNRGPLFSAAEIQAITASAVSYFQKLGEGEKGDCFITLPRGDDETISGFLTFLAEEHPGFSVEQLQALDAVYRGPVNPRTGERIYNGMPLGSERFACGIEECQQEESPHFYPFIWAFGEAYDGYEFDFDADVERLSGKLADDLNANDPDLTAFETHGGKLLLYSGSADPCVPYPDAMNYYGRVLRKMGGYQKVQSFCRYFLFPGKDHGRGGMGTNAIWANADGADELTALRLWREEGKPPEQLLAVGFRDSNPENGISFIREIFPVEQEEENWEKCPPSCSDSYLR